MEKIALCLLLTVAVNEAFFLRSREIQRMLRFLPGLGDLTQREDHHLPHKKPILYHRRHSQNVPQNSRYRDDYYNDRYERINRYKEEENSRFKDEDRYNDRYLNNFEDRRFNNNRYNKHKSEHHEKKPYHEKNHHENCKEHHDHSYHQNPLNRRPQEYLDDRYERYEKNEKTKYEPSEEEDYYEDERPSYIAKRNYKKSKQPPPKYENERPNNNESDNKHDKSVYDKVGRLNYKKDYVTGVLVTVPKMKNDEDLVSYFKNSKEQNLFFQNLLKTENDSRDHDHNEPEELIKAYIY